MGGAVFIFPEAIHPDTALERIHQSVSPDRSDNPETYKQKVAIRGILNDIKGEFES